MKKLVIQLLVFSIITLLCFIGVLSQADGNTDPYYIRFTTPRQQNLIIGTSRAAQGLQPEIFKKACRTDFFNYSFTIAHSPYGETYLNSIKKKIIKGNKEGIFIVTVDPWSISSKLINPNDSNNYTEKSLCLGNTNSVNRNPNFEYLIKNLRGNFYTILTNKVYNGLAIKDFRMFLHDDGWLEVTLNMDSLKLARNLNNKIDDYKKALPYYKYSSLRFQYLKNTIELLNQYGEVYLVRLPIHERMMEIENKLMPNFNVIIRDLIPLTKGYFDMTPLNNNYSYTDGNHLEKSSGKLVSEEISKWMNGENNSNLTSVARIGIN